MNKLQVFILLFVCSVAIRAQDIIDVRTPNSKFRWKKPRYVMPWLRGPNVCAVEEVEGTRKKYFSDCMPVLPRKVCQKRTFIRFHCCTGYEQTSDGKPGCSGVKPVHNLMETAKHLYLRDFRDNVRRAGLEQNLRTQGPYTIFAPHNEAFKLLSQEQRDLMGTQDETQSLLRLHMTDGRHDMADLRNGDHLPSLYYFQETGELKINRYTNGITTVNCVRISLPDQGASNGVIHVIEEALKPHSTQETVMDILLKDDRFGEFVTALITTDVSEEIRDKSKSVTVFAPTDEAFTKASPELIERILKNKELVRKMLRYHIVDQSLCSPAIIGDYTYETHEGQRLNLSCDINDQILVNGKPASDLDLVGSNGVIHALDDVLIPDSVKAVEDILLDLDLGQFIEYGQGAGLSDVLTAEAPGNYTVFAPTAHAFNSLDKETKRKIQTDTDLARKVIRYHVVPEAVMTRAMTDGMSLTTMSDTPLRVTIYQEQDYGVGSAKIISADHESGNGVIHVIDRILLPPEENAVQKILAEPELTTFYSVIKEAGLLEKLQKPGHYTIFAPSNDAFDALPTDVVQRLLNDPEEIEKVVSYHIMHKPVFTNYLRHSLQYRYNTLAQEYVRMERASGQDDSPVFVDGTVKIIKPNIESTSGVIHVVDGVLTCPCSTMLQGSSRSLVLPDRPVGRRGDTGRLYRFG